MNGLEPLALQKAGLLARILGRRPKDNAWREIHNIVASNPISEIRESTVPTVLANYRIDRTSLAPRLLEIYRDVARHYVADHELTDSEVQHLRRLRDLLGLADRDLQQLEAEIYREEVRGALGNHDLTTAEKDRLEALLARLRLPAEIAKRIFTDEATTAVKSAVDHATEDRRLSDDEGRELMALAENLGVDVKADTATSATLHRCRMLWLLEQGQLPTIDTEVRLQRGEVCHAAVAASHHEQRTRTRAIRYGGPTARIRICKGLYWTAGQVSVERITEDSLVQLDTGTLYITNKRLLFDGARKNTAILLRRVLTFTVHENGLLVEKDTGKDQFFACSGDLELLGVILDTAHRLAR